MHALLLGKPRTESALSRMIREMNCLGVKTHPSEINRAQRLKIHRDCAHPDRARQTLALVVLLIVSALIFPQNTRAQVDYVARFTLEKQEFMVGEPIFCNFIIKNTGARAIAFRYRSPDRSLNLALENEPHFKVTGANHRTVADPAPRPCGGAKGSAVYGSVSLPPGQTHVERWLLNQWANFARPGRYYVRADRHLPLLNSEGGEPDFSSKPVAFAGAINDLQLEVVPGTEAQLHAALGLYIKKLDTPPPADIAEPVLVATNLPQPFFLARLIALAHAPVEEHRWDRTEALEGLARLGTPEAWRAVAQIAQGKSAAGATSGKPDFTSKDDAFRAHAILLLAEKADRTYLPTILEIISGTSGDLRGDALRALGFFHNAKANEVMFQNLHSKSSTDRVNAVLGLKNLNTKEAVPALLDMMKDPDNEVRQVANFALQGLTRQHFSLSPSANLSESERVAQQWHEWWQTHAATFTPTPQSPCHDW
jgi:hypothetical protein